MTTTTTNTPAVAKLGSEPIRPKAQSFFGDTFSRLRRSPSAQLGGFLVIVMVAISIAVPVFDSGYNPTRDRNLPARYDAPDCVVGVLRGEAYNLSTMSCEFPMGADKNGRNIMRRVGHGMSVSLIAGLLSVSISLSFGTVIGLTSGYLSGWVDSVAMRTMDIILAFPSLLLAIALVTVAGPSLINGMIAVAITQIPLYARLSRSMAISIRNMEYVTAARSTGAGNAYIVLRHVFPNSLAPIIVQATLGLGTAVVETAALGFLGLGQQAPYPELGKMLAESQEALASGKWWVMVFPGAAIILIVLGFNLFGDGLRDALDPRLRGSS